MSLLFDKPYAKRVLQIASPAIAGLSSQMVVSIIDTAMVGRLGDSEIALAAMGLGVLAKETHGTVIRFAPPLVISKTEVDWALDRVAQVLK